jgi:hypothetical protein
LQLGKRWLHQEQDNDNNINKYGSGNTYTVVRRLWVVHPGPQQKHLRAAPPQSIVQRRHTLQMDTNQTCLPVHVADENVPSVHVTVVVDGV